MQNLSATSVWPGDRWVEQTSYPRERTESANSVRGAVDIRRGRSHRADSPDSQCRKAISVTPCDITLSLSDAFLPAKYTQNTLHISSKFRTNLIFFFF